MRVHNSKVLISVVGPTAVGKTDWGIRIAKRYHTEIISSDSRQFYREMNIGTAKPTSEELGQVNHHFVDCLSIHESYSAAKFQDDSIKAIESLFASNNVVVMVGGSGLFAKAVWHGLDEIPEIDPQVRESLNEEYVNNGIDPLLDELREKDPEYFNKVDIANPRRIIRALEVIRGTNTKFSDFRTERPVNRPFNNLKLGLELPRELLYDRINQRMDTMIERGLFEEARQLFFFRELTAMHTVGYSEIFDYLENKYDRNEAIRLLKRNSRRYAKRQLTWFKRDPDIHWFDPREEEKIISFLDAQNIY